MSADFRLYMSLVIAAIAVIAAALITEQPAFLVVALCIPLAVAGLRNFGFFFDAMVLLVPWNPTLAWALPIRDLSLLTHFVLFAGVFIIQRQRGSSIKAWLIGSRVKLGVWILAVIAVVSLVLGPPADPEAWKALAKLLSYVLFFFSAAGWLTSEKQISRTITLLLISGVGVALFGFYQAFAQDFTRLYFWLYPMEEQNFDAQGGWAGRITSLLFHYNSLAGYLNVVIPAALGTTLLVRNRGLRYLGFLSLTTALAALYLTGSRGGLIACAGIFLAGLWYFVPRRATVLVMIASLLLAAAIAVPLSTEMGFSRSQGAGDQNAEDMSREGRLALWGAAGLIFLDHPVLGAGYGNFKFLFHNYVPGVEDNIDAHNLYLQFLSETGIVGFAVFFYLITAFARMGFRLRRAEGLWYRITGFALLGTLAGFLLHGMVDFIFGVSPQFGNIFWLTLGLGLVAFESSKTTMNTGPHTRAA
jgi:putative inorganic carbon (HCO3(-)) transporter